MGATKSKYAALAPREEYLSDPVVLAQAWKKSHTYIRRHNWYADTLELDCSAVDLETRLNRWSEELRELRYQPNPIRLVPAPKNAVWVFGPEMANGWGLKNDDGEAAHVLRPLAHLGIREQTVATAVMLCLADCIETAQGDPGLDIDKAAASGVHSYGNRLYCHWSDGEGGRRTGHFSWGNSDTYSRYFQDYQTFVQRPLTIAHRIESSGVGKESIYVIKLDLTAFFDRVDIHRLVQCLKKEYSKFSQTLQGLPSADETFWTLAQQVLTLSWEEEDVRHSKLLRDGVLPKGLPQGMVSSGFFANAYLIDFDRGIASLSCDADFQSRGVEFRLHDYCRYVDDLRLVVSLEEASLSEDDIARAISEWVQVQLDKVVQDVRDGARLEINAEKTEVEKFEDLASESGAAARMRSLQQELSGPFDMNSLQQVEAGLNGLLALAELGGLKELRPITARGATSTLAAVARPKLEVRDDTLTRFSAYRLAKSLRLRRSMTDLESTDESGLARDVLRHDFEVAARRLVASWATNPSLVQVLRYALDLFPSPELLGSVTSALIDKLGDTASETEKHIAFYVLGELFRAGATETGRNASTDLNFVVGDISGYRGRLADTAMAVLQDRSAPWYVMQQASLFLGTQRRALDGLPDIPELQLHKVLQEFLSAQNEYREIAPTDTIAVSLVGHQMIGDVDHYRHWFRRFAFRRTKKIVSSALELIGQIHPVLYASITGLGVKILDQGDVRAPRYLEQYNAARWSNSTNDLPRNEWLRLAAVLTHPSAPFSQENALLELARSLAAVIRDGIVAPELLTPLSIELRSSDWGRLNNPEFDALEARYVASRAPADPRYATPPWVEVDQRWMYAMGRLLRAAATGEFDFTARHWALREVAGWYSGIQSTWHKRRIGMLHTSKALAGTSGAITPWFSELLLRLLRWPGIADGRGLISEFESISRVSDFLSLIEARKAYQLKSYGASSNLPIYVYPVDWPLKDGSRNLRIVIVQGLMPAASQFDNELATINAAGFRAQHRDHTAALLSIAYKKIQARDSVLGVRAKPTVDLVVLPEYCVHVDDQDLMRAFSDATGSMLFYGLVGGKHYGTGKPINTGRWLVPQRIGGRRSWIEVDQGKWNLTSDEKKFGVQSWRPYQVVIELKLAADTNFRISGAVCYDATDLALAADLKNVSHMFVVAALNRDVKTFDSMVGALRYHMYQHVLIANTGEFGGSTAQAPYNREHERLLAHAHGANQIAVNIFDLNVDHFGPKLDAIKEAPIPARSHVERIGKTPPAGLARDNH